MGAGFKYHERYEPSVKHKRLEDPLRSEARTGVEAMVSCEVDRELDLGSDMEIVASEMTAEVVPQLGLGEEDELVLFEPGDILSEIDDILTPEITEAAETKAFNTEDILHSPDEGELQRNITGCTLAEGLEQKLEIECVVEVSAVKEIVKTEEEVLAGEAYSAVVLHLEAERSGLGVLPEIEAPGDLHVTAACKVLAASPGAVVAIEIVIDEEEGVAPIVIVESFESGGEMTPVLSEIVECLEVGLSLEASGN